MNWHNISAHEMRGNGFLAGNQPFAKLFSALRPNLKIDYKAKFQKALLRFKAKYKMSMPKLPY
jgi:hypothetical protein